MVDAEPYIWWPRINRDIVRMCKECTIFGNNLKSINKLNSWKPLPLLNESNQKIQLDYAGPHSDGGGGQIYFLVTIGRYSNYPSVMLTRTTGAKKILKFLKDYITILSIPNSVRTDQYSGYKNNAVKSFCVSKGIKHIYCPLGDHRVCDLVEKTIQTIKRKLGVMQLEKNSESIETALKIISEDIRINKNSVTYSLPFELQFGKNLIPNGR